MSVFKMVTRNFPNIDRENFAILHKTHIRPQKEYCIQAWSPYLAKDTELLEKVQRRATKCVTGRPMKGMTYEQRLQLFNINRSV